MTDRPISPFSPILGPRNTLNSELIPHGFISSTQIEFLDSSDEINETQMEQINESQMHDLSDLHQETQTSTSLKIHFKKRKLSKEEYSTPIQTETSLPQCSSNSEKDILSNNNVCEKLNFIITYLHTLNMRIEQLESQNTIRYEKHCQNEAENQAQKYAENKILRENLIINRNVQKMISNFTGDENNEYIIEIEATFPIGTVAQMSDVELRLKNSEFAGKLEIYLRKYSGSLEKVFRFLAADCVYIDFNLDGRAGKKSLNALMLYKKILFDACGGLLGREKFEKELRKCVLNAHNRFYKKKKL